MQKSSAKKLKVLHLVEYYHPSVGGMQEVVKRISEGLIKQGHDVTVATSRIAGQQEEFNGVKIVGFNISGKLSTSLKGDVEGYLKFLKEEEFDVIGVFASQQWTADLFFEVAKDIKAKKVFVPTGFSGLYDNTFKEYFNRMRFWLKDFDVNVFLSDNYRDINFSRELGLKNSVLIPNGASAHEFNKETDINICKLYGLEEDNYLLFHVGSFTGHKGQPEAIKIFFESGISNATLLFHGNVTSESVYKETLNLIEEFKQKPEFEKRNLKIIVKNADRLETVAAFKQSDLFIFPSNIECSPIVLFEAAAAGLPFLATPAGNTVEISTWLNGGFIMPSGQDPDTGLYHPEIAKSAAMLNNLHSRKDLKEIVGKQMQSNWAKDFTWEKIISLYDKLYTDLTAGKYLELGHELKQSRKIEKKYSLGIFVAQDTTPKQLDITLRAIANQTILPQEIVISAEKQGLISLDELPKNIRSISVINTQLDRTSDSLFVEISRQINNDYFAWIHAGDSFDPEHFELLLRSYSDSAYDNLAVVYVRSLNHARKDMLLQPVRHFPFLTGIVYDHLQSSNKVCCGLGGCLIKTSALISVLESLPTEPGNMLEWQVFIALSKSYDFTYVYKDTFVPANKDFKLSSKDYQGMWHFLAKWPDTAIGTNIIFAQVNQALDGEKPAIEALKALETLDMKERTNILAGTKGSLKLYILKRYLFKLPSRLVKFAKRLAKIVIKPLLLLIKL